MSFRFVNFLLLLCLFAACRVKRGVVHDISRQKRDIRVFIELPQNDLVFENVSPLIHELCTEHFERVGYNIVMKPQDGYTLRIIIKSLDPIYKYISPDIVLVNTITRLELVVQLLNYGQDIIAQKKFGFNALISKPHEPILNSDFLEFEYTKLLKKSIPKIEQYFRPFLLKSAD